MRPTAIVPVLLVAALAGCIGDTADDAADDAADLGEAALAPAWQEAVRLDGGGDAETSMHIEGDVVLLCSHGGFEVPSTVWASTDGGFTFARQDIGPNPIPSGDCDLEILDDGSWVVVYDTIASATVAVSQDQGVTWSLNFLSALPIAVDRPWLASEGNTIIMSYANVMAVEPHIGMVATSDDHGLTWSHELYALFESPERINHVHGDILVSDDTWRIPVGRADFNLGLGEGTSLEVYTPGGMPWTRSTVATTDVDFVLPSLSEDGEGTLYYLVPRGTAADLVDIHVAWSTDRGATWTESGPVARDQSLPGVIGPWIDGSPARGATIAWRNATDDTTTFEAVQVALADGALAAGPVQRLFSSDHRPGQLYEFLMVDHDQHGAPWVFFIHDDGSGCAADGSSSTGRLSQCLWMVRPEGWDMAEQHADDGHEHA